MELQAIATTTTIVPGITLLSKVTINGTGAENRTSRLAIAFEDGADDNFMDHYFHFMEYVIALIHGLDCAGLSPEKVDLVLFPSIVNDSWRGSFHDHNYHLIKAFFSSPLSIVNKAELNSQIRELTIERLLVIARKDMDHRAINKMCAGIFSLINHAQIQSYVNRVYGYFGLELPAGRTGKPVVTYVGRKRSKRRLPPGVERKFEQTLTAIPEIEFSKVFMEDLSFKDQIDIARKTDAIIGLHGNGLTHSFFMPPNGIVIEIFPKGTFQYDYFSMAQLRDHRYFAFNAEKITPFSEYVVHGSTSRRIRNVSGREIAGILKAYTRCR